MLIRLFYFFQLVILILFNFSQIFISYYFFISHLFYFYWSLVFKGPVFAFFGTFLSQSIAIKIPHHNWGFCTQNFWSGPVHRTEKTKCSKPPIVMGNFNSNALAQKIAKKGKNQTLKHYWSQFLLFYFLLTQFILFYLSLAHQSSFWCQAIFVTTLITSILILFLHFSFNYFSSSFNIVISDLNFILFLILFILFYFQLI